MKLVSASNAYVQAGLAAAEKYSTVAVAKVIRSSIDSLLSTNMLLNAVCLPPGLCIMLTNTSFKKPFGLTV